MACRLALAAAVLVLCLSAGPPDALGACTAPVKAAGYEGATNSSWPVDTSQWAAQSFKVAVTATLAKVSLDLQQENTGTDSITAEIHADAGDTPGTLLGS